jgi:Derlin-2/3
MNRQPAQVGGGDSVSDWYKEIPLVTKLLFTSTVAATVLVSTGMCDQGLFYFASQLILRKFHIWRLFTPFIFSFPFSIDFAMHTYLLYDNCRRYELNPFNTGGGGNSSDFLFMVLLGMAAMCVAAYFFNLSLMSNPLLYMIMYALYSPWVSLLIYIVMGYSVTLPLIGIAVGHIYFFVISVLPDSHGIDLIRTPEFCEQAVRLYTGNSAPVSSRVSAAPAAAATGAQFPNLGAGHQWGRGRALGSD